MQKISKNIDKPTTLQGVGFARVGGKLVAVCGEKTINPRRGERLEYLQGQLVEILAMEYPESAVLFGTLSLSGGVAYLKDDQGRVLMQSGEVEGIPCGLVTDGTTCNVLFPFRVSSAITMVGEEITLAAIGTNKISISI